MRARRKNGKPRLRNALFNLFWKSCVFDGFLVFSFVFLKSIMPVFLAQLLSKLQPNVIDSATSAETNGTISLPTSSTTLNTTVSSITISYANDDDDSAFKIILQYMMFIW
jgi:hypothetical protein